MAEKTPVRVVFNASNVATGLAEFPVVEDAKVVAKLESLGVTISEFGRVEGRPREENAAKA